MGTERDREFDGILKDIPAEEAETSDNGVRAHLDKMLAKTAEIRKTASAEPFKSDELGKLLYSLGTMLFCWKQNVREAYYVRHEITDGEYKAIRPSLVGIPGSHDFYKVLAEDGVTEELWDGFYGEWTGDAERFAKSGGKEPLETIHVIDKTAKHGIRVYVYRYVTEELAGKRPEPEWGCFADRKEREREIEKWEEYEDSWEWRGLRFPDYYPVSGPEPDGEEWERWINGEPSGWRRDAMRRELAFLKRIREPDFWERPQ